MRHIPIGYKIVDGKAVVDEPLAEKVLKMYTEYLDGKGLMDAARNVGINVYHGSAKRILENKKYLGDDYYPQIIDSETFENVKAELERRAIKLGRTNLIKEKESTALPLKFIMKRPTQHPADPFAHAAYLYSLIESEDL